MTKDEPVFDDLVEGLVGMVPVVGPLAGPIARRIAQVVRDEHKRNISKSLEAAERVSGLTREELADLISTEPSLVPLLTRLLYAAGMTGQDEALLAMGAALGDAFRDPKRMDEAEILLISIADLRSHHIVVLRALEISPSPDDEGETRNLAPYMAKNVWERVNMRQEFVELCLLNLAASGLVSMESVYGGTAFVITDLGKTVLEVLEEL